MESFNFITVGSNLFYHLINYSTKLLLKIYPNSKLFIYDWGMTQRQKKVLESYPNTVLIDWTENLKKVEYDKIKLNKNLYGDSLKSKEYEYLFTQKSICMLDCSKRIKKNLIYIDGDAFVINDIDELLDYDFDIGVTVRLDDKIIKLSRNLGIKTYINAGVIFFKTDSNKIQLFLNEWIEEIKDTSGFWLDQTALNNLISKADKKIFSKDYCEGILRISNTEIKIKTFPCEIYNKIEMKKGFNPKYTKILHFRASQHGYVNIERIKEIIKEFRLGPFYFYFLKLFPVFIRKLVKEIFNIYFLSKFLNNPFRIRHWLYEILRPIKNTIIKEKK